jgi:tetratricopeptide (TPR) repeat protein
VFPRGELYLACGLALTLRLGYLVGVAHSPLFLHPVVQAAARHPYAWFLAALNGLTGGDPLLVRLVQILLDAGSVFLLGATAHEIWGRRAAVFTAQVAALYGSLIYFTSDLSPATFSFALVCASLYWCARMARMGARGGILISGVALALAVMILVQGGAEAGPAVRSYFSNLAWVWNRHKVPCGVLDQAFFAPFLSPIFRLPWLLSFALVGPIVLVTAWKERRRAPLLGGYLLCVTLALAATPVCDRTRLALLPAALPLVGRGVDEFLLAFDEASARAGAWLGAALMEVARKHGGILIALGLAAAFVNVPPAQRQRPPAGMGWWIVARAYIQAENPREAEAAFDRAERTGFGTSAFYAEWGRLEYEKRTGILAAQHLLTAIQLDPGNGPAHETLGDVYATREDFEPAGQEYAVAAGLIPSRAPELDTRAGEAYLDGKSPERARAMFEKALRESPGYEAAQAGLNRIQNPAPASRPVKMFEPLQDTPGR